MTAPVALRFLGSGDAFGSGGRFQTCMGRDMLAREAEARAERAHDGLVVML